MPGTARSPDSSLAVEKRAAPSAAASAAAKFLSKVGNLMLAQGRIDARSDDKMIDDGLVKPD